MIPIQQIITKFLSVLFFLWLLLFPMLYAKKVFFVLNKEKEYSGTFIDTFLTSNFLKRYVCEKCGEVVYKSIFAFLLSMCWSFTKNIKIGII